MRQSTYDQWRTAAPPEPPDWCCIECGEHHEDCQCHNGPTEPEPPEDSGDPLEKLDY